MSVTMNHNSGLKSRVNNWALNAFAISLALFPIISLGYWANQAFAGDPRKVVTLETIKQTDPRLFEEPLISVTFDDGWESIYTEAAPLMDKYDIASTQYIVPGLYSDEQNYISLDQAHSLRKGGHEIASHTWSHENLAHITLDEARMQLTKSHDALKPLIDKDHKMSFASPESSTNAAVMPIIKDLYSSHRNTYADFGNGVTDADVNIADSFDRYNIIGFAVRPGTTDAEIQAAIDYARLHNGWLVLVYHQIDDTGETYSASPKQFERHLKLIKNSRMKTALVRDVMESYDQEQKKK
jgi:peptidoglycan/xylan/chitin deacetylase (PgdA/CDA1 family)